MTQDHRHEGGVETGGAPAVSIRNLSKRYGGVVALDDVSLEVERGVVHAVVGENGAGKSSLMKILAGATRADAGQVWIDGEAAVIDSPGAARDRGIGIVHQELSLLPPRSVLANLFVNREETRFGLIDRRAMRAKARPILERIGLHVDLDRPVGELRIAEQQLVELSRVLLTEPRLLILDEPNSALNEPETQRLFAILRQLCAEGITILYVSHRLEEVFAIADRITVVRNGRTILTRPRSQLSMTEVVEAMIGAPEEDLFPSRLPQEPGSEGRTLRVSGLGVRGRLSDCTFTAQSGEILGLAGMEGSGISALLGVLFGTSKPSSGDVVFPDGKGPPSSPYAAARRGVSLVPADRRRHGLMLSQTVAANLSHVRAGAMPRRNPWLGRAELTDVTNRAVAGLRIKTASPWSAVNHLSGGNQQKVVVGKWLEITPDVVLLDDPTRGIDVGAKREIFLLMRRLSSEGRIVLFRSTELPELVGICDEVLIFYRGRLVGQRPGAALTSSSLLHAINTGQVDPAHTTNLEGR